jgi:hypothetical protein
LKTVFEKIRFFRDVATEKIAEENRRADETTAVVTQVNNDLVDPGRVELRKCRIHLNICGTDKRREFDITDIASGTSIDDAVLRHWIDRHDVFCDRNRELAAICFAHHEVEGRQREYGANAFGGLDLRDRATVQFEYSLPASQTRPKGRAVKENSCQAQIVRGYKTAAEAEALESALAEECLVSLCGIDVAEAIDRLTRAVVRAECRKVFQSVFRRCKLADVNVCGQELIPEVPLAHGIDNELLLPVVGAGRNRYAAAPVIRRARSDKHCHQQNE